jgi:hypothetical protein
MKGSTISKLHKNNASMKAVIIYDSFPLAAKANAMLQRATHKADATMCWNIRPWRVDVLRLPPAADEALTEAIDAYLILLASHNGQSLRSWLNRWLEQWATCRKIKNAALAVISDQSGEALLMSATNELFQFAVRHGLEFIMNSDTAVEDRWTFFSRSFPKSNQLPPSVQPHFLEPAEVNVPGHWGINE